MAINLGETTIKCQGHSYVIRLTSGDLRRLEPTVGKSYTVAQELANREVGLIQLDTIMTRAFLRADPRPEKNEIEGMLKTIPEIRKIRAAIALYSQILVTDEEEDGKDEEEEGKKEQSDPLSSEMEE